MSDILLYIFTATFFASILRVTTPILFATLGSVVAERAGTPNIALEAIMLFSALFGALGSGFSESIFIGFLAAVLGGFLVTSMLVIFSLRMKADIILAGIALNLLAVGGTVFIMYTLIGDKGATSSLPTQAFPNIDIPIIEQIPFVGELISGHNLLTYVAFFMVFVVWFLLFRTKLGTHIRATGENTGAATSVGINVLRTQATALYISGFLASMGGAFMSMAYMNGFSQNMIAGRGFIALAAASMGRQHPVYAAIAALIFGIADAISIVITSMSIPDELVKMIPYITTIIGLIIFAVIDKRKKEAQKKPLKLKPKAT